MVFISPPHPDGNQFSYGEAYNRILATHRRSPLASASSVVMFVSPNVDAICASRMLADLFKHDDVGYCIVPVCGYDEFVASRDALKSNTQLHTLIFLGLGGNFDLSSEEWFGEFDLCVTIHVIDSTRPRNLSNLFLQGENGERILVWDDGEALKLVEEKKSWEALEFEPEVEDDDEDDSDDDDLDEDDESVLEDEEEEDYDEEGGQPGKRRSLGDGDGNHRKRRRTKRTGRMSREERYRHDQRLNKYYTAGAWHGQSVAGAIYILATVLERVDNDFLWLAILGLTYQYVTTRISREYYETYHAVYFDEVSRLNTLPTNTNGNTLISLNPDDASVRATEELRFMLFRHWTLYDAMFHSSYVASKLGIWKERGKKRLTGLLAKMGFSILQTQQPYSHMDMDLKKALVKKLGDIAPEYGLVELTYPSFMRCFGYHSQPLSAADAVEGISALLDVAGGVRMEVEIEGARNGGEWFSGGRVWEAHQNDAVRRRKEETGQKVLPLSDAPVAKTGEEDDDNPATKEVQWWVKNFWTAYDALTNITALRESLNLSMSLHRAIIRQGTSIIDKQDIRTMRNYRLVVLQQGPDLALFAHPGVLSRLALWLVDALRDRVPGTAVSTRSKRKSLPFVVACLNETTSTYMLVGIMAALDFGDVRRNQFSTGFIDATKRCNGQIRLVTFDATVLEIEQKDLEVFTEALSEVPQ